MIKLKKLTLITLCFLGSLYFLSVGILAVSGLNSEIGKADIALVLGSKVETNGLPSLRLRARLDKTLELYGEGYFKTIIVSGGMGKEGYDEAVVMRDYLVEHRVPIENIIMDNNGINTYASAKNTARIISQKNLAHVFVISQYFHLPRACFVLRGLGVSVVYAAYPKYAEIRDLYALAREVAAYIKYAWIMRKKD